MKGMTLISGTLSLVSKGKERDANSSTLILSLHVLVLTSHRFNSDHATLEARRDESKRSENCTL